MAVLLWTSEQLFDLDINWNFILATILLAELQARFMSSWTDKEVSRNSLALHFELA